MNEQVWHTPKECTPPIGEMVWVDVAFKYGGEAHASGKYTETGWELLADWKEYRVVRWRHFSKGKL